MAANNSSNSLSDSALRQRVNRCLLKLSDRDTHPIAALELDSLARSLSPHLLPSFLSAISLARPDDKTPLRRHSLRLLSLLSSHHPSHALSPLLPRMLSAALRRLRDPDSSVRLACVDAVRSISLAAPPDAFLSAVLRPLCDALLHEQDHHAQLSAALCLAAAVDARSAPPPLHCPALPLHLQKLVPKLVKLLRSNAFKAKAALISLLGSAVAAGGAGTAALTSLLVPCLVEALAWEEWAARKAAAETLCAMAEAQRDLLVGFKAGCIASMEARRFDKVKIVRESMNRMLELWKGIPDLIDDDDDHSNSNEPPAAHPQSRSSAPVSSSDGRYPPAPLSSSNSARSISPVLPTNRRLHFSKSTTPDTSPALTNQKNASTPSRPKKLSPTALSNKSDCKIEISVSKTPLMVVAEEKNCEDKANRVAGFKSSTRVVPYDENAHLDTENKGLNGGHKDDGDLSKIQMQLVQIENQQTNLLDLLQKFIGTSQSGIHSLETRVHGIEIALDEISRDLAVSSGRNSNVNDNEAYTCCRIPGTEFLSPKYWRRNEGRYTSRFSVSESGESRPSYKWDRQHFGQQGPGFVVNPLAEINPQIMRGSIGEIEHAGAAIREQEVRTKLPKN